MRARSALFTLFGDVVRPAGGEAWLSTLTGCMGALGFTPEATRTALHRMTGEGWVEPRRVGRYAAYRLTGLGLRRLEEAAARIYRLRAADWDGFWRLLVCPAAGRDAELGRALAWLGFGRLSAGVWVSPHDHDGHIHAMLGAHADAAMTFEARHEPAQDVRVVREAWDLRGLHAAHETFLARWRGVAAPSEPALAFPLRIELVHHWRSFLFLDPGLPGALLPDDWLGEEAASLFRSLYESLESSSWRFYDELAAAAPAPLPASRRPDASPFAIGLEALSTRRIS
jgi:phenylacetic acid degradation operon negative regulatory protein